MAETDQYLPKGTVAAMKKLLTTAHCTACSGPIIEIKGKYRCYNTMPKDAKTKCSGHLNTGRMFCLSNDKWSFPFQSANTWYCASSRTGYQYIAFYDKEPKWIFVNNPGPRWIWKQAKLILEVAKPDMLLDNFDEGWNRLRSTFEKVLLLR